MSFVLSIYSVNKMILTSAVRCLLLTVFVILILSGKSECLTSKVKNGEQIESSIGYYRNINSISQTLKYRDKKSSFDGLNSKGIKQNTLYDSGEKKCRNKLCEIYARRRVIRQIRTGYPSYPQPQIYPQQSQPYQNNIYKPPTNNYGNYPNVKNIYPHYPNTTQYRPSYNSTYTQLSNSNNFSYPNPGFSSSSKHTYPPSPRPYYNQFPSNNRPNTSQTHFLNNPYPYNTNPASVPPFYNTTHPNYPNSYPNFNSNIYPSINPNSLHPQFGQNNTKQTGNYPNNQNTMPNHPYSNVTHNYPYNQYLNNPSLYNGFTQRAPLNPYPNQRNASSTYPYNVAPSRGTNGTHGNNYSPGQYYPTSNFTPTIPFGTTPNITQNKFSSNPNSFYYNGPQYDPLRQPPERLSY